MMRSDGVRSRAAGLALGVAVACLAAVAILATPADAQYSMARYVFAGGGASGSTGGAFALLGTVGAMDPGTLSGGVFGIKGGFWQGGTSNVGVEVWESVEGARSFALFGAVPNPVARQSLIAFEIPRAAFVRLEVYDAGGRVARKLVEGSFAAGRHSSVWNGAGEDGRRLAPGVYFMRLEAGGDRATNKVTILH